MCGILNVNYLEISSRIDSTPSALFRQIRESFGVIQVHVNQIPFIISSLSLALCLLGSPHVHQELGCAGLFYTLFVTHP